MRISGRNLNKKEDGDNLYKQPPLYERPELHDSFYPPAQPIKRKSGMPGWLIAVIVVIVLVPVGFFTVGIVAAIAIPSLLESRKAANQGQAIANLRSFHVAQSTFASAGDGKSYGEMNALANAGLIEADRFSRPNSQYSYTLTFNASRDRYCLVAVPRVDPNSKRQMRAYGVGSDGVVYYSEAGIACASGELGGSALTPLQ